MHQLPLGLDNTDFTSGFSSGSTQNQQVSVCCLWRGQDLESPETCSLFLWEGAMRKRDCCGAIAVTACTTQGLGRMNLRDSSGFNSYETQVVGCLW